jgi:hypothetical protein
MQQSIKISVKLLIKSEKNYLIHYFQREKKEEESCLIIVYHMKTVRMAL